MKIKISLMLGMLPLITFLHAQESNTADYLNEITVQSASGYEQDISKAPASISVISKEDLKNKAYKDVSEAISDIPGAFVNTSGNSGGKGMGGKSISLRGMPPEYTLILIDGKPMSNSTGIVQNGAGKCADIGFLPPMSAIEKIEVIKGPMSSLYGSQAMGGIVNVITKKTTDVWVGNLSIDQILQENSKFGNEKQYKVYTSGPLIKNILNLTLDGSYTKKDEDNIAEGSAEDKRNSISGKLDWVINNNNALAFKYSHISLKSTVSEDKNENTDTDKEMTNRILDLTHKLKWNDGFETESYVKTEDIDFTRTREDTSDNYDTQFKSSIFNTKTILPFDTNILIVGLEYKTETAYHNKSDFATSSSTLKRWNGSFFLEDEYFLTDDFSITSGLRVTKSENLSPAYTPRIYGVYALNNKITVKGGISAVYRAPELKESDKEWIESSRYGGIKYGNEDLKAETSTNYEIGFDYKVTKKLNLAFTTYKSDFKDKIEEVTTCQNPNYKDQNAATPCSTSQGNYTYVKQYQNINKAEVYGYELSAKYIIDSVTLNANYTYTKTKIKSGESEGMPLGKSPEHMYNLKADWNPNNKLKLWSKLKYRGTTKEESRGGELDVSRAYTIVDTGVKYDLSNDLSVHLNINNLLDKEITTEEYNNVLAERNYNIGLNYQF